MFEGFIVAKESSMSGLDVALHKDVHVQQRVRDLGFHFIGDNTKMLDHLTNDKEEYFEV